MDAVLSKLGYDTTEDRRGFLGLPPDVLRDLEEMHIIFPTDLVMTLAFMKGLCVDLDFPSIPRSRVQHVSVHRPNVRHQKKPLWRTDLELSVQTS